MMFSEFSKKPLSLVDLCVRTAIDNVKYIGYVGGVDFQLLDQILQHCTLEQLIHIEDSTQDTDLSPVTNKLWKIFYKKRYGEEDLNVVVMKMKRNKVDFEWRDLYEAKLKVVQEAEEEAVDRLKKCYKNEDARKQGRQTKLCAKAPPSKRGFWASSGSGYNLSNVKSNIMKKAKLDLYKSQEVKNLTAIKRNTIQKCSSSAQKRPGLSSNMPSTSRSNSCVDVKNLNALRMKTIQKSDSGSALKRTCFSANAPSTSRSMPCGETNLPPKRINGLPRTSPPLYGERNLPHKSLAGTAPSKSRNAATKRKSL